MSQFADGYGVVLTKRLQLALQGSIADVGRLFQAAGCGQDVLCGMVINRLQAGQDVKPQLIAHDVGHQIGAVGHEWLIPLYEPLLNVVTADAEQRAYHVAVAGLDARKAVQTGAPDEVHQNGFYGIILMVGYADGGCANVLEKLLEVAVAQLAGSHLDAYFVYCSVCMCVKVDYV